MHVYILDSHKNADILLIIIQCKEDKEAGTDGVVEIPDETAGKDAIIEGVVANINWQMDNDRKSTALKQQQGLMYKDGFTSGKLKAQ